MKTFAYFSRPRSIFTIAKYLEDIRDDAKDWLKSSRLSKEDIQRALRGKDFSHDSLHALVAPLKQPSGKQVKVMAISSTIKPSEAYRILQYHPDIFNVNMSMESKVFGLEGRKPSQILGENVPLDKKYWKGRRVRKKELTQQHIQALNLTDILSMRASMPELFDPKDIKIFSLIESGKGSNREYDYVLRKYGKYLKRAS